MQAVFQNIPLHELAAVRFSEHQTARSAAYEVKQHRRQGLRQIHHAPVPGISVLRFHVVLKLSALGFLHNLQGAGAPEDVGPTRYMVRVFRMG